MLQPSRVKYRNKQRGRRKGIAVTGSTVSFGDYGLKAVGRAWLTARQIEAARRAMTRYVRRDGRMWIRIFPDVPVSTEPAEVRMGKGKGSPEFWMARVKPGRIVFELDGVSADLSRAAFELGAAKLPMRTRFVARIGEG
ncbi:MAG: 50S ribosomal protein L16 [Proteobacteria bacterium]|nr:50S ribosomal protein L16 [Pseudomonadota bacterium]